MHGARTVIIGHLAVGQAGIQKLGPLQTILAKAFSTGKEKIPSRCSIPHGQSSRVAVGRLHQNPHPETVACSDLT